MTHVEPLLCNGCGAAVPLGDGDLARCSYCESSVQIPSTHRELRRLHAGYRQSAEMARVVAAQLDAPLSAPVRALGRLVHRLPWDGQWIAFLIILFPPALFVTAFLTLGLGVLVAEVWRIVLRLGGTVRLDNPLSPLSILPPSALAAVLIVGIPLLRYRRELRLAHIRADAWRALGAKPPLRASGPSRCRQCDAALELPEGALVARCLYCDADNLAVLPNASLTFLKADETATFQRVDEALDALRRSSQKSLEGYFYLFVATVLITLSATGFAMLLESWKFAL